MIGDNFMWFPEKSGTQISGETTDTYFAKKNAFEVSNFSFTISSDETTESKGGAGGTGGAAPGGGGGKSGGSSSGKSGGGSSGKAKFGKFTIDKVVDTASVPLYKACSQATVFPTIILAIRKSGGSNLIYLQYIFRYNQVTGITWSGGSGSERPKETMTFSFKAMGVQYIQQHSDGREGKPQQWSWNTSDQGGCTLEIAGIEPAPSFLTGSGS